MRDGIPRRLTFIQIQDGYKLLKSLNVLKVVIGGIYTQSEIEQFAKDDRIDVVIK